MKSDGHACRKCRSSHLHRSHRRGILDRVLSWFGAEIRRCSDCRRRYAWFKRFALPLPTAEPPSGRWREAAVLGSGFLACLAIIWWMITRFGDLSG